MTRMILKVVLAGVLGATLAPAQHGGGSKSGATIGDPMPSDRPNRFDQISNLLKLNKDQKKLLRTTMDEAQKEAAPLREQMAKSQVEIGDAVAAGKSQQEIDQAASAFAALQTKMAAIELKAFAKIYNGLDKGQQPSAGPVFLMMNGVFKSKNWMEAKP